MKETRKTDKIKEIELFIRELETVIPMSFEDYKNDFKIKAICERYFEKIIEAVVDLVFIIIKEKKLKIPDDEESSFILLHKNNIISSELSLKLKEAKGMRNIIAHGYGEINDELVFEAIKNELVKDTNDFIKFIKKLK